MHVAAMTAIGVSVNASADADITLFLGGDTMTGRGIDQILPTPSAPELYEAWVKDARDYVALAERIHGPIERPVSFDYIWGDALGELERMRPAARIVNLETSVTTSPEHQPGKGIHYRMHPDNTPCLTAAGIDCCVLANNHVLDWGERGLKETLATLAGANIVTAGAGDTDGAARPAVIPLSSGRRVLVFAYGLRSSGIPGDWRARRGRLGVNLLDDDLGVRQTSRVTAAIKAARREGDIVVASIHWGPNWGYAIRNHEIRFARRLIDDAGVDVVHGHSSHHPKAIEIYQRRPIIYGCGDLLTDYEGISGHENYRGDLSLLYFPAFDAATGELRELRMSVMQMKRMRLARCSNADALWLAERLSIEGQAFGTRIDWDGKQLVVAWR